MAKDKNEGKPLGFLIIAGMKIPVTIHKGIEGKKGPKIAPELIMLRPLYLTKN